MSKIKYRADFVPQNTCPWQELINTAGAALKRAAPAICALSQPANSGVSKQQGEHAGGDADAG